MTPIPQMDCCTMLGIDPKTLRNWLRHASMQFVAHPTDARLKCLTLEQVQQLANLHARPLQMSPAAHPCHQEEAASPPESYEHMPQTMESEVSLVSATSSLSDQAELRKAVCSLEAKVMTLQEHLTQLTLELLRERTERYESRLGALEAKLSQSTGRSAPPQELVRGGDHQQEGSLSHKWLPQPGELRARSRIIPHIEYGALGTYVLACPREGVLSVTADSQEWFNWLASLTSFRFVGPEGRFTAYREGQTRSWKAYRTFHGRTYRRSLGVTSRLTIAHLEQIAAVLQSALT
jgi:hypothetical protein